MTTITHDTGMTQQEAFSALLSLAALTALVQSHQHRCPMTAQQIRQCGPWAAQAWAAHLVDRAHRIYRGYAS